jgi:hypothetical protein
MFKLPKPIHRECPEPVGVDTNRPIVTLSVFLVLSAL